MLLDRADRLRQIGHPGNGQPCGRPGAGLHDRTGHADTAALGDDNTVGPAQIRRTHNSPQIVGVLDSIAEDEEGRLALGLRRLEQIVKTRIRYLGCAGGHTLMIRRAAHLLQLVGGHTLDHRTALLGQGRIVASHRLRHRIGQVDRIHRAAAFQQLGHGILAPYKGIGTLGTVGRLFAFAGKFFHSVLHCIVKSRQ